MIWENPIAWASAAVPALLLLLALLRPRRRDLPVGSLLIWRRALRRTGATRPPADALPAALAAGLAGVLLLVPAWAGPALTGGGAGRREVLVILDRSAAMRSLRADGATRFDEARRRCAAFLRSLNSDDGAELLLVPEADPAPPSGPPARLADFVDSLTPAASASGRRKPPVPDSDADWVPVWRSRTGVARSTVVFTSRPFDGDPAEAPLVDIVGGRPDNLAIASVADLELPDGVRQIVVEVRNTGTQAAASGVRLSVGSSELPLPAKADPGVNGPAQVTVAPGAVARVYWTGRLPAGAESVEVRLTAADALADDNSLMHVLAAPPRLRVLAAAAGGDAVFLDKLLSAHPRAVKAAAPAQADLVIAAGAPIPADWAGPVIAVGRPFPDGLTAGIPVERRTLVRFALDADSVFSQADLAELPVAKLVPLQPAKALGQRPAAWTDQGEVAAAEWSAAPAGGGPAQRRVALGFSCGAGNVVWNDGLLVFWGRLLDSFLPAPAEPPPPSRPLADADRPLPADAVGALPASGAAPPTSLRLVLLAAAGALLAAGWWLAGSPGARS